MKILKSQLQKIIKEEHDKLLNEAEQQATGASVTPEDGKYYEFVSGGRFTNYGKYIKGKGFVRVEHEDFYKRAGIQPYYDQGTAVREIDEKEVMRIVARKLKEAENVEKYSIRND